MHLKNKKLNHESYNSELGKNFNFLKIKKLFHKSIKYKNL